ncbi:hypothetical protein, conserved [Leishmania tarentolae]|uniref:Uncharacterized protein n=1 Tax=Leishmania tarentolae TaxID=5689 RepID=A0A640KH62_LEITA|nr:hypothetical protein, conserved [Leishmania tarentolae]
MMTASNGNEQLDALVDSILQSRDHLASPNHATQRLPSPQQQQPSNPTLTPSTEQRERTSINSHNTRMSSYMHAVAPGCSSSAVGNVMVAGKAARHMSASPSRATATHLCTDDEEEEEDLNTLVERILAGPGVRVPTSTSSPRFSQVPPPHVRNSEATSIDRFRGPTQVKGGSSSLPRMFGADTTSPDARMQAVVRRLTLWYERKEAKRVQAVYEALEREQLDCTFEPCINRLEVEMRGSGVLEHEDRPLYRHHYSTDEYPHRPSASLKVCGSPGSGAVSHANTISLSSSPSRVPPHMSEECIPSLQPPPKPIAGADVFVERLRRAQDERDAIRAAEKAKRLHYYDPTTFRRDPTVPVPFEFVETHPRRLATATDAAVGGSPSRDSGNTLCGTRANTPSLSLHTAALAAYRDVRAISPLLAGDDLRHVNERKRLTPENTFLSLAPHIRQTLLFDQQMEAQLRRATNSVRRATGGE